MPRMTARARRRGGMWSSRVGLGDEPGRGRSFRRDHRQAARGVRPAGPLVRWPDDHRHRIRPRPPPRGGHREGHGARRSHQRRQLEHHDRPRRPRDLQRRAGGRPHLRPAPCCDLPAPRHPDRRDRVVGLGARDAPHPPRAVGGRLGRSERQGVPRRTGDPSGLGGPDGVRARRSRDACAWWPSAAWASRRSPSPTSWSRKATSPTSRSPATRIAAFDARLAEGAGGRH